MRISVIDSGMGGVAFANNLKREITDLELSLLIDHEGFPYGDKDIFLMTSLYEGMPNALAEAMCKGVPAISTDCDFGPRDLIINDDMGILLKDFDLNALVNALENMIDNYDNYVIKAKNSKEILKSMYSFESILSKWENIFR